MELRTEARALLLSFVGLAAVYAMFTHWPLLVGASLGVNSLSDILPIAYFELPVVAGVLAFVALIRPKLCVPAVIVNTAVWAWFGFGELISSPSSGAPLGASVLPCLVAGWGAFRLASWRGRWSAA